MVTPTDGEILSGFLCPICKIKLDSAELLLAHYVTHREDGCASDFAERCGASGGVRSSWSNMFDNAIVQLKRSSYELIFGNENKKRPATISEKELKSKDLLELFNGQKDEDKKEISVRSHTDYFYETRSEKIKNQGRHIDKILNNLRKKLYGKSEKSVWKKLMHEDSIESEAKDCSTCQKSFNLLRKKHHCKLCEESLCDDCSVFLEPSIAESILNKSEDVPMQTSKPLRHCEECKLHLEVIKSRSKDEDTLNTKLIEIYKEMHNLKRQLSQTVETYKEIHKSLMKGKTIHNLSQAVMVKDHIKQRGKEIELLGTRIGEIPAKEGSRKARILTDIQQATNDFVMELLALPKPPSQKEIDEARLQRSSDLDSTEIITNDN